MTASIPDPPRCAHVHAELGRCIIATLAHDDARLGSVYAMHLYAAADGDDTATPAQVMDSFRELIAGRPTPESWAGRCQATFFGRVRCYRDADHDGSHHSSDPVVW